MRRTVPVVLMITAIPLFMVSAQDATDNKKPPQEKQQKADKHKVEQKTENPKAEQKAERKEDLKEKKEIKSAEELTVDEFLLKRNDLKGKIVELTFDRVISLKQAGKEGYIAVVSYQKPRHAEGVNVLIPAEGLGFFKELDKPELQRRATVYIEVLNANTLKALGTRYREDKPKGERYGW